MFPTSTLELAMSASTEEKTSNANQGAAAALERRDPEPSIGRTARHVSSRSRAIVAVWVYTILLCSILGGIAFYMLRSIEFLLPVIGVCFCGGIVGTLLALEETFAVRVSE